MSRKRHKPEEIVAKLRQVDVLVSQGQSVVDAVRSIGVTEVGFGTSCWMGRSSPHSARRRSSSRAGGGTTTACAPMPLWDTDRRPRRCSCQPSPHGRLRSPDQLRRRGSRRRHTYWHPDPP